MKILEKTKGFMDDLRGYSHASLKQVQFAEVGVDDAGIDKKNTIFVADNFEPNELIRNIIRNDYSYVLQKNTPFMDEDFIAAAQIIANKEDFFVHPGRAILHEFRNHVSFDFCSTEEKEALLKKVEFFLLFNPGHGQRIVESVEAIVEELYMNAIFDAPAEAEKLGFSKDLYKKGMKATLNLTESDKRLVITCSDPFGAMNFNRFLSRLDEIYEKGAGKVINFGSGGSGIGCYIMFEHCSAMYIGVQPGKKTVVSCVLPLKMNYRQRCFIRKTLCLVR